MQADAPEKPAEASAMQRCTLNAAGATFTVQAFAGGLLSSFAHNPRFAIRGMSGELAIHPDTSEPVSCNIVVDAGTLELIDTVREQDRAEIMRQVRNDVLETARYPRILFNSTAVASTRVTDNWLRVTFRGRLVMHGMTGDQEVDAQMRIMDDVIRLSGEFSVFQSQYNIARVKALGGAIQVKDELKFKFDLPWQKESQ